MSDNMAVEVDPNTALLQRAAEQLARRRYLPFRSQEGGPVLFILVSPPYFAELQALERAAKGEE